VSAPAQRWRLAPRLAQCWYRPARLAWLLLPLGLLYRGVAMARTALYRAGVLRRTRVRVPVVIVGNITVGGSGKTPLARYVIERLLANGRRPGLVSRSYAAGARAPARVHSGDDPALRGDEAVLLACALPCPVWSGPDRLATAQALLAAHPEVDTLVCDDGLQHHALARDVEIAVIDAARGFGNGLPLPAGPLREPVSRLRTVDAIVLNGAGRILDLPSGVPSFALTLQPQPFRNLVDGRTEAAGAFRTLHVVAMAGIGHPERFFATLRDLGLAFEAHAFPDHHRYSARELAYARADAILMTEKDAIKCAAFGDARMWAVPVAAVVSGDLAGLVLQCLERATPGTAPERHAV
jgi:tetraacyldisaccharide 4'-kinase